MITASTTNMTSALSPLAAAPAPVRHDTIPGTAFPRLELFPIGPGHAAMMHGWIADPKARDWLDLGSGRQSMSERDLYLMLTSPRTYARLFRLPGQDTPLGLICLNDVQNQMGCAEVWGVRGVYAGAPQNTAVAAFLQVLEHGFRVLNLQVISSWVVDGNQLSIGMHRLLGMTETGRQRQRHVIGARRHDRVLFDMTRAEFDSRFGHIGACHA
jgi:RimJ/RimL family protein N-acetyltransferase